MSRGALGVRGSAAGGWTDAALPNVGKAGAVAHGLPRQVRDSQGVLVLTWDGAWSLPAVGYALYLPEVRR